MTNFDPIQSGSDADDHQASADPSRRDLIVRGAMWAAVLLTVPALVACGDDADEDAEVEVEEGEVEVETQ